jgi:catalase
VRFSQVAGEMGYPDTVRDIRGFALKFYTEDGIWDLVGNNTPIFFVRDSILFPSFIHVLKRNPVTHLRDWDMFWDMVSLRPETTHQVLIFFSDRGIPNSYRRMHGYGSNTFALVNDYGSFYYCKFHYKTDQGIGNLDADQATKISGEDPDYLIRDLYNAIASGNYPSWSLYLQIMTPEQAAASPYDPFDVTKVWLHAEYPLIPVGKIVFNRNPKNYFAEVEQMGFDPAHLIPGIEPSPDRMLQGRLFNYGDTHRYRLGTNNLQLPVNRPFKLHNYSRDGYGTLDSQGGAPNYHPNSFGGPESDTRARGLSPVLPVVGNASRYDNGDEDNFTQARLLYQKVLNPAERGRLINNIVMCLKNASEFLQERAIKNFSSVDADFGRRIKGGIQAQLHSHAHAEL